MKTIRLTWFWLLLVLGTAACSPQISGTSFSGENAAAPTQAAGALPQATAMASGAVPVGAPGSAEQLANAPIAGRMVIKNADLELLVQDSELALDRVTQLAADFGGYIISAQTWQQGDLTHATLRLGIPSVAFESALNQLRAIGLEILRENTSGEDVSAAYVDLESRLSSLEATAARVREFLADAQTVEEALQVNERLSALETQIEQVRGQTRYFEGRSAFSTVTVTITPQLAEVAPEPEPVWSPLRTAGEAADVLANGSRAMVDLVIWLVIVLGPLGAVVGLGAWVVQRMVRYFHRGRPTAP